MNSSLKKNKNIWEIETHFKCPVIGALLSVDEHKKVLKKCGVDVRGLKPYQYHQVIMEQLSSENHISIKVNHVLKNKSRKTMLKVVDMGKSELLSAWESSLEKGDAGSFMFAVASMEGISQDLLADVFGEMHMMEHSNQRNMVALVKDAKRQDEKIRKLEKKLILEKNKIRALATRNGEMEESLKELRRQKNEFEFRSAVREPVQEELSASLGLNDDIRDELTEALKDCRVLEREKRKLQVDLFESRGEKHNLLKEVTELTSRFSGMVSGACPMEEECENKDCPEYRLCARRVLMVGGITKMEHLYRNLVETGGGEFDYHDGYMKNGNINLEARIKRSDVVICPVNCNSHAACLRVKKLCGKYRKNVKMLASSSLSALTDAVFENNHSGDSIN